VTSDRETAPYKVARALLRPSLTAATKRDWVGQHHIPRAGGCVVATNHISHFDPLTMAHFVNDAGRAPRFLAKAEIFDVPVVGAVVAGAGQIPVERATQDAARAFSHAVEAVSRGECVVIYPEGTLTRDADLWPMSGKTGAARVALTTGCPVIPVAQWGPQDVLWPYGKRLRLLPRKTMHVHAGPPVDLSDLRDRPVTSDVLRQATTRIIDAITVLLADIRRQTPPADRYDHRQVKPGRRPKDGTSP
jgi:1-acyl-sn-glycerol-3-phosphate acyltransferase